MTDQSPALKIIFQKISRKLLKEILSIDGKPIQLNWSLKSPEFEEALFNALKDLRATNESRFYNFCTVLFDINAICTDDKKGHNIIAKIKEEKRLTEAHQELGLSPSIELWVSWVYLRMPNLWNQLKHEVLVKQFNSLGGQKKYIKKPPSEIPSDLQLSAFKNEFLAFMERERSFITFLHTIVEDMGQFTRYILHVNPFPKQVEKFDDSGIFGLGLNKNADAFTIVHDKREKDFLRIKCEFSTNQRHRILEIFAKYMLSTEIIPKPTEEYPISKFNPTYEANFKLTKKSDLIESLRVSAATIEISDPTQISPEIIKHTCKDGDVFPRLEKTLHNYPIKWRRPISWEIEFHIHETVKRIYQETFNGDSEPIKVKRPRKYNVRITETSLTISNNPSEPHQKLILDTLADNGIKNVYKKEYLAKEYRK